MKKTKLITVGTSVLLLANAGLAPATVLAEELTTPNIEEVQTEETAESEVPVEESEDQTEPEDVVVEDDVAEVDVPEEPEAQGEEGTTRAPSIITWGEIGLGMTTGGPLTIANEVTTGVLTIDLNIQSIVDSSIADKSFYRIKLPNEFKPLLEDDRFVNYISGQFKAYNVGINYKTYNYTKNDIKVDAENCELTLTNPKVTNILGIFPHLYMTIDIDLGGFVTESEIRIPSAIDGKYHFTTAFSKEQNIIDWTIGGYTDSYGYLDFKQMDPAYGTAKPVITAEDRKIVLGEDFTGSFAMKGVKAYDEEDGDITHKVTIVDGKVNSNVVGTYPITYGVKDSHGLSSTKTINVTVGENSAPVINAWDQWLEKGSAYDPLENVTAYDEEDGDVTKKLVVVSNNVNTSVPGTYYVTYRVEDNNGETTTLRITVYVYEIAGSLSPDKYATGSQFITGKFTGSVAYTELYINDEFVSRGGEFWDGQFSYWVGDGRILAKDSVKLVAYSSDGRYLDEKNVTVVGNGIGSISAYDYTVGNEYITGIFSGDVASAAVVVNGNVLSRGGYFENGKFSYWIGAGRINANDYVTINGYDKYGNLLTENNRVFVNEKAPISGAMKPNDYLVGDGEITGTYSGDVRTARLTVNGKVVSWGGTFANGQFSYYVGAGTIKAGDTVVFNAYGENNQLLDENINVNVITSTTPGWYTSANYKVGEAEISGTYGGSIATGRLLVNGKVISWGGSFDNGQFSYYVGSGSIQVDDTVILEAYDANGGLLDTTTVKIEATESHYTGTITPSAYNLGNLEITGLYTGDVVQGRLYVNGSLVSIGGTFNSNGTFSYFVGDSISRNDTVQLRAYAPDGTQVDAKTITVR